MHEEAQDDPNIELPEAVNAAESNEGEVNHRWLTHNLASLKMRRKYTKNKQKYFISSLTRSTARTKSKQEIAETLQVNNVVAKNTMNAGMFLFVNRIFHRS